MCLRITRAAGADGVVKRMAQTAPSGATDIVIPFGDNI